MYIDPTRIFVIAGCSAVLFAFLARRSNQLWWTWALWGALLGLAVGTTVIGLVHSGTVPYTTRELSHNYLLGEAASMLILIALAIEMVWSTARRSSYRATASGNY